MQHRRFASMSAIGRPSGTDGSDFSNRMVVDFRYTKVAERKSRLCTLITIQVVIQFTGALFMYLSSSKQEGIDVFAVLCTAIGFISLVIGELGRRCSGVGLLKVYMIASSMSVLYSAVCLTKSNSAMLVIRDPSNQGTNKFEVFEISHVLLGFLVHIFAISTSISLIGNMSPPKRASWQFMYLFIFPLHKISGFDPIVCIL